MHFYSMWAQKNSTVNNMVAVLLDPFRGMGRAKEIRGDPTVGPRPMVWTNEESNMKEVAPERLRCGTIQEVSLILQLMSAGAARRILPFYPVYR